MVKKHKKYLEKKMQTDKTETIKAFVKLKVLKGISPTLGRLACYDVARVGWPDDNTKTKVKAKAQAPKSVQVPTKAAK